MIAELDVIYSRVLNDELTIMQGLIEAYTLGKTDQAEAVNVQLERELENYKEAL